MDENIKKFIVTCWDGDIYILTGYESVSEIREKMIGLDWVTMPNGSEIKQSSISKIQSFDDYRFQQDQKTRHKKGQYLGHCLDSWYDHVGEAGNADVKSITGAIKNTNLKKLSNPQAVDKKRLVDAR